MKKITVPCIFGDQRQPVDVYFGETSEISFPLEFQARWLFHERGGVIPEEIFFTFNKLNLIARENGVAFESLTEYAFGLSTNDEKIQPVHYTSE